MLRHSKLSSSSLVRTCGAHFIAILKVTRPAPQMLRSEMSACLANQVSPLTPLFRVGQVLCVRKVRFSNCGFHSVSKSLYQFRFELRLFSVLVIHAFCRLLSLSKHSCQRLSYVSKFQSVGGVSFSASESSSSTAPNKACTRRGGVCAIYRRFSGFGLFHISSIVPVRPHAGNANRWALALRVINQ